MLETPRCRRSCHSRLPYACAASDDLQVRTRHFIIIGATWRRDNKPAWSSLGRYSKTRRKRLASSPNNIVTVGVAGCAAISRCTSFDPQWASDPTQNLHFRCVVFDLQLAEVLDYLKFSYRPDATYKGTVSMIVRFLAFVCIGAAIMEIEHDARVEDPPCRTRRSCGLPSVSLLTPAFITLVFAVCIRHPQIGGQSTHDFLHTLRSTR